MLLFLLDHRFSDFFLLLFSEDIIPVSPPFVVPFIVELIDKILGFDCFGVAYAIIVTIFYVLVFRESIVSLFLIVLLLQFMAKISNLIFDLPILYF